MRTIYKIETSISVCDSETKEVYGQHSFQSIHNGAQDVEQDLKALHGLNARFEIVRHLCEELGQKLVQEAAGLAERVFSKKVDDSKNKEEKESILRSKSVF